MADPIRWYINLPQDDTKNQGPQIQVKIKRKNIFHTWQSKNVRKVVFDPPAWKPAVHDNFTKDADKAGWTDARATETAEQKEFVNKLKAPPWGGLIYTITAKKPAEQGPQNLAPVEVETWRRLYYTVVHVGPKTLQIWKKVEEKWVTAFAAARIELVRVGEYIEADGGDEEATLLGPKENTLLDKKYRGAKATLKYSGDNAHLRILLVREIAQAKTKEYSFAMDRGGNEQATYSPETKSITFKTGYKQSLVHRKHQITALKGSLNYDEEVIAPGDVVRNSNTEIAIRLSPAQKLLLAQNKAVKLDCKIKGRKFAGNYTFATMAGEGVVGKDRPLADVNKRISIVEGNFEFEILDDRTFDDAPISKAELKGAGPAGADAEVGGWTRVSDKKMRAPVAGVAGLADLLAAGRTFTADFRARVLYPFVQKEVAVSFKTAENGTGADKDTGILIGVERENIKLNGATWAFAAADCCTEVKLTLQGKFFQAQNAMYAEDADKVIKTKLLEQPAVKDKQGKEKRKDLAYVFPLDGALAGLAELLDAGKKVNLEITTWAQEYFGGGYDKDNAPKQITLPACIRRIETDGDEQFKAFLLRSACHELGHAMTMAVEKEKDKAGAEVANDGWHDDKFGGQGNHCKYHCKKVNSTTTSTQKKWVPDSPQYTDEPTPEGWEEPPAPKPPVQVCIMHHSLVKEMGEEPAFCPGCKERLMRAPVKLP